MILARFIPIVRTFCPPVAGAALMPYGRYVAFDVAGGYLWVGSMILGGYFLGSTGSRTLKKIFTTSSPRSFLLSLLPPDHQRVARQVRGNLQKPLPLFPQLLRA